MSSEEDPFEEDPFVTDSSDESEDDHPAKKKSKRWVYCGAGCCVCVIVLPIVLYYGLVHYITGIAIGKFVTINDKSVNEYCDSGFSFADLAENLWWPGCGVLNGTAPNGCGEPCFSDTFLEEFKDYNARQKAEIVHYKSRPKVGGEIITLRGWLLKSFEEVSYTGPRPRVVVQHGYTSNSNKYRQQVAAYLLRRLGYDVLINNFRDHCYSDDTKGHMIEWGDGYPYDLLGAWDYLREDPDNWLGGELPAEKVGLFGQSMGAFVVVSAFGMEGRVPGAWADSPPGSPKQVFETGAVKELQGMGLGAFSSLIIDAVWSNTEAAALDKGIDINKNIPSNSLVKGPDDKRPLQLVAGTKDTTVPIANVDAVAAIANSFPDKYDVSMWVVDGVCHDDGHCIGHLLHQTQYLQKLCLFWKGVFNIATSKC